MFEGAHAPPYYTELYNFKDGAQEDIFEDSYPDGLPPPGPHQTQIPTMSNGPSAPVKENMQGGSYFSGK